MSQVCSVCERGALSMNKRSKSMIKTKSKQKVNIQTRSVGGKKVKICTRCIRTMSTKPEKISVKEKPKRLAKRRNKKTA